MKRTSLIAVALLACTLARAHEPKTEVIDTDEKKSATILLSALAVAIHGNTDIVVTKINAKEIRCSYSEHGVAGPIASCRIQKGAGETAQLVQGDSAKDLYSAIFKGANGDEMRLCDKWECRLVATDLTCDSHSGAGAQCSYYFAEIR